MITPFLSFGLVLVNATVEIIVRLLESLEYNLICFGGTILIFAEVKYELTWYSSVLTLITKAANANRSVFRSISKRPNIGIALIMDYTALSLK